MLRRGKRTETVFKMGELEAVVDRFPRGRVLVLGDIILDHYLHGTVTRISPEAPVPVFTVDRDAYLLGGAANVARNVAALGARADLVGLRGGDDQGTLLASLLRREARMTTTLVVDRSRPTTLKTRAVSHGQQMLRLDRESTRQATGEVARRLLAAVRKSVARCGAVIVSDYAKGVLSQQVLDGTFALARRRGIPVFVDPKGYDYRRYRGASFITPNLKEAQEASGIAMDGEDGLERAAKALLRQVGVDAVFITLGPKGVGVFPRRGAPLHLPARAREVFDVTGAGDTFIAVSALSVVSGATLGEAAALANAAAGVVVGHAGVATVSPLELRAALESGPGRGTP